MEEQDVIAALAALAHETRLDVFRLLVQAGPAGVAAGVLAEALDTPPATLSFHLKELRNAQLVQAERDVQRTCTGTVTEPDRPLDFHRKRLQPALAGKEDAR